MEDLDLRILTEKEILEKIKEFSGWNYHDDKISKEFKFKDFLDSLMFVNYLAPYCQAIDHHPDVHIYYSKVVFELQRFSVGGKVTERDFKLAEEIERLYGKR